MLHVAGIIMRTRAFVCTLRAPTLHPNSKSILYLNVPVSRNDQWARWQLVGLETRRTFSSPHVRTMQRGGETKMYSTPRRYMAVS